MTKMLTLKKGFTLMETIVAIGVVAIALTFFLAAFAPATLGIKKAGAVQEAKSLASALEAEMNTLRSTVVYPTAFEKAFQWVRLNDDAGAGLLVAFKYRADSGAAQQPDGFYPAFTDDYTSDGANQPMIVQNYVGGIGDPNTAAFAATAVDSIFVVKLTQLVYAGGVLTPHINTAQIVEPRNTGTAHADSFAGPFPEAVVLLQADFYRLKTTDPAYLTGTVAAAGPGALDDVIGTRPIYTTQFGVLR